ncbi:MAG: cytochrome ubiquinol oxidase subunit I, partial [Muribaculaceae bacterium]|nr:cytochrome ubiquinol oxidase subunit I [Muribaculaceae bacterium]
LLVLLVALFALYKKPKWTGKRLFQYIGILSIPIIYVCSQCGWIVAEVGRQPWTIQDILPAKAAISDMTAASVQTTFFIFLFLFCGILIAEICIMLKQIRLRSNTELSDEINSQENDK